MKKTQTRRRYGLYLKSTGMHMETLRRIGRRVFTGIRIAIFFFIISPQYPDPVNFGEKW
jgi:hypothetical protein